MKPAAAMQAGLAEQRRKDLAELVLYGHIHEAARRFSQRLPTITVLLRRQPCTTCTFWRDRYDVAQADADHLARQLAVRGVKPEPARLDQRPGMPRSTA